MTLGLFVSRLFVHTLYKVLFLKDEGNIPSQESNPHLPESGTKWGNL
jgi:hypothetical protein